MTYDSTFEPEEGSFPMLRVYLDGLEQPGNMQSDMSKYMSSGKGSNPAIKCHMSIKYTGSR